MSRVRASAERCRCAPVYPLSSGGPAVSTFTAESALVLLRAAGVFYWNEPDPGVPQADCELNMNDTWGWALSWGEYVPDDKLIEVARLFWQYGWAGCLYWVSERHERMRSEFEDINRMVDFVRHEEDIRRAIPDSNRRAYFRTSYSLPDVVSKALP